MPSENCEPEVYHTETVGRIGDVEVTIAVEGDECLAELVHTELYTTADELKQIVNHSIPPDETVRDIEVDWEAYQNGELPKQEVED